MADRCSFCGSTAGPFNEVGGLFTVLMCADCQAARGHGSGPYPVMTRAEMRAGLDLLPTWALEQKAAANRQVIAVMRQRLAAGEQVAPHVPGAGAGLAGAPSRGRRGPGRRAPRGSQAPLLMWMRPHPTTASAIENKHGRSTTSGDATIGPLTLASSVVAYRLLSVGCRVFAAPVSGSRRRHSPGVLVWLCDS